MKEQKEAFEEYKKATLKERQTLKFFKLLPIELLIDQEAINVAKNAGLTDPVFTTGRMSDELAQKIAYIKLQNRSN